MEYLFFRACFWVLIFLPLAVRTDTMTWWPAYLLAIAGLMWIPITVLFQALLEISIAMAEADIDWEYYD